MTHRPVLLAAALLALVPSAAKAANVWTTIATEKVLPGAKARPTTDARIASARNEFEAFQVVVTGPASGVSARMSDLVGPGKIAGAKLMQQRSELALEIMVMNGLGWEGEGFKEGELAATRAWLFGKAVTIYGGSTEIQNNVVAKRILGMLDHQ